MAVALIVEDDADVRALFQTALERVGFTILTAASANAAIRLLESNTPDIAFIDMNMPERPGTAVLAHIQKTPRLSGTKTVVVTANTRSDSHAAELGADLFLIKPVPVQELLRLACRLTGMPDPY
jgi:CheY-like chemotaxis protein